MNQFYYLYSQKQTYYFATPQMYNSIYLNKQSQKSTSQQSSIADNQSLDSYLRKKSEQYFFKMASQQLTYDQMKVQFSKDILTMFLTSVPANIVSQAHVQQMEQHLQENMTFLKTLYPQPKTSVISRHIFQGLKQADLSDRVQYDLLANIDFKYEIKNKDAPRMDILTQTEILLNNLITSSQKTLTEFTNLLMSEIPKKLSAQSKTKYESLMKQPWRFDLQTDIAKTQQYNKQLVGEKLYFPSIQLFRVISQWTTHLQSILQQPEKYLNQVDYLKMAVGRPGNVKVRNVKNQARIFNHFPNNADSGYSQVSNPEHAEQIKKQNSVSTQSSETQSLFTRMYNKIVGLCSGQQQKQSGQSFQKLDTNYKYKPLQSSTFQNTISQPSIQNCQKYCNYQFKRSGYMINNFIQSLQDINRQAQYSKFCEQQLQFLRKGYIQTIRVVDKNKVKQKYTIQEKKVYSFSQNCYYFMEEIVIQRLIKLIQTFLKLKQKSQNQFQKCMVFQDVDLIRFNEKSVISAFIVSDETLLMEIYNAIIQLTKSRQAKIAKIQNRFGTASNDAIITLKIKNNPILCKLRLVMQQQKSGPQSKQKALANMHQFLTEIQQSPYGPISYLSLLLATKDFRVTYLQSIRRNHLEGNVKLAQVCHCGKGNTSEKSSINTFQKQIKNIIGTDGFIKLDCYRNLIPSSFVCGVCQKVVKKGQCVIPVPSCAQCGFHICVQCSFDNNPQAQIDIYAALINSVVKVVDPCYFSQLQLADNHKKNYNHSFTKDVQVLSNNKAEIRKQVHYHVILEGANFVRFGKMTTEQQFWEQVKQKIDLRTVAEYKDAIKQSKFVGILFRPRQLLREKGQPFIFLIYDSMTNKFSKFTHRINEQRATQTEIMLSQIQVTQNDAFMPILWIFGQSLVTDYITKVLQTNPFCVKKIPLNNPMMRDFPMDHMRFSRSKITSHHIMR